jgi:pyruvate formate lyase activating enzyme
MTGARMLAGRTATVAEILGDIERDEVFYHRSGGGVTVSGGEPMAQSAFAGELLKACAQRGIHTAMETSAYAPWQRLVPLLDVLDLIYVDIKHMDDAVHRSVTGIGNRLILDNIHKLDLFPGAAVRVIRVPVIPGVNDTAENIRQTAGFVKTLRHFERVELLPFHRYGLHSYAALGRVCALTTVPAPSVDRMRQLAAVVASAGLPVQIGG